MSGFVDGLFLFVTMALPKAGVQVGPVPVTANIVLFMLLMTRGLGGVRESLQHFHGLMPWYGSLLVFGSYSTLVAAVSGLTPFSIAQRLIVLASPFAAAAMSRIQPEKAARIVALALMVTSGYALMQFAFGITETSIAGLTFTSGQSLELKPIGYTSVGDTAVKMPSTYQNGNSFGIFCALGLMLMLVWRPQVRGMRTLRFMGAVGALLGLLLCGSRSIVIPVAFVLLFVIAQYVRTLAPRAQQAAVVVIIAVGLLAMLFVVFIRSGVLDAFWNRNAVQTLDDPTAAGRTDQWSSIWQGINGLDIPQLLRLILIGQDPSWGLGGEGLPAFFVTFGLFATLAFYGGLLIVARRLWQNPLSRPVALGVLCVMFAFMVDTSYFYPPNLMNVYLMATLALKVANPEIVAGPVPTRAQSAVRFVQETSLCKRSHTGKVTR